MSLMDRPSPPAPGSLDVSASVAGDSFSATAPPAELTVLPTVRAASPKKSSRKPATTPRMPATAVDRNTSAKTGTGSGRFQNTRKPVAIAAAVASWSALTVAARFCALPTTSCQPLAAPPVVGTTRPSTAVLVVDGVACVSCMQTVARAGAAAICKADTEPRAARLAST